MILQNHLIGEFGAKYVALGMLVCSKEVPRLTLNYFTARFNVFPNSFKGEFVCFLKIANH